MITGCGGPSSTAAIDSDVPASGEPDGDPLMGLPLLLSAFNSEESLLCIPANNDESLLCKPANVELVNNELSLL